MKKIRLTLAAAGVFVLSVAHATTIASKFSSDPLQSGWQMFGDTNLFRWDSTNENLAVTWDSSRPNSYFYHPLGATYTKADSFCVLFNLNLTDAEAVGYFQIAVGLCNFADATSTNFSRANASSPNLFEFDYYPDGPESWGPSIDATMVDANSYFYFAYETNRLQNAVTYQVVLIHRAGESAISGMVLTNGQIFTALPQVGSYGANDFHLDTLAICNYTATDDIYGDSLLAHGTVDNLAFASPLPVDVIRTIAAGTIQFAATTNWLYTLQRSPDFQTWTNVLTITAPGTANLILHDTNAPSDKAFYRVTAVLP